MEVRRITEYIRTRVEQPLRERVENIKARLAGALSSRPQKRALIFADRFSGSRKLTGKLIGKLTGEKLFHETAAPRLHATTLVRAFVAVGRTTSQAIELRTMMADERLFTLKNEPLAAAVASTASNRVSVTSPTLGVFNLFVDQEGRISTDDGDSRWNTNAMPLSIPERRALMVCLRKQLVALAPTDQSNVRRAISALEATLPRPRLGLVVLARSP